MSLETTFSKQFAFNGIDHALVGIVIFSAADHRVRMANSMVVRMAGHSEDTIVGLPLVEAMPEVAHAIRPEFPVIWHTGQPCLANEVCASVHRQGEVETAYFNLVYQPLKNSDGVITDILVVITEVTKLVRTREDAQSTEDTFRSTIAQSPIPMAILRGPDWVVDLANDAILVDYWGRRWEDVKARKLLEVFPELVSGDFHELLSKVYNTGIPHIEKDRAVAIRNSPCSFVDLAFTPLMKKDNTIYGVLLTANDVSGKVRGRIKTEENETRLKMVIEASGLGTWDLNLQTGEFHYSDEYLASFGEKEHLSHEQLLQFMHPEDLPVRKNAFREAVATGRLHYFSRLIWKDRTIHWIEARGKVLYDDGGEPVKMIGVSRDITEEKRYQQDIQEREEKFRLLASAMPQFIWTSDAQGNLNYFNQSVFDYCGMTFEQLQGLGWIDIIHPEDRANNIRKWRESVTKGTNFLFEHRFRRSDGLYRWQLSRAMPHFDDTGKIQMWVGTSTDIHDQKTFAKELEEKVFERTKELKETNEVLERTNRELEQFAYIASHDLQEPLRKIQTFADILKKNIHDEVSAQKYFSKIDSSAQRMGDLIRSVLDYSRIPSHPGQLTLTDLNEIVENVKMDFELMILEKNAVVDSNYLPAIPGIKLQLQQLFANLIGNALKFCRQSPQISIWGRAVPGNDLLTLFKADENKQYVELRFSDNGIGFETRYKEQIFTIFQRLHGWQQYSGTGIGLALCKKIVDNHQGYVTAESEPGKGSTFIVYLPA